MNSLVHPPVGPREPWATRSVLLCRWVPAILGLALGTYQLVWVGRTTARLAIAKVWVNRSLDAISRSADAAYGQTYMEYIQFLRSEIPEDALVVVTQTAGLPQYDSLSFLQYFLFPRRLVHCPAVPGPACFTALAGPDVFFLGGDELAIPQDMLSDYVTVHFDQGLVVLMPREGCR